MATTYYHPLKRGTYRRSRGFNSHRATHPGTWYGIDESTKVRNKVAPVRNYRTRNVVQNDYWAGRNVFAQVRWANGKLANMFFWYAHLLKTYVRNGRNYSYKQLVGLSDTTGRVTGPHLHWSMLVRVGWRFVPVNPDNRKRFKFVQSPIFSPRPKPKPKPKPKPVRRSRALYYTVRRGDWLSKIARRYRTTWPRLVALNRGRYPSLVRNPGLIRIGWRLRIK